MPQLHPVVFVVVLVFSLAIWAARLVVWFLELRGLSDPSGRRQAMVVSFGTVLMAMSMWLETKPH